MPRPATSRVGVALLVLVASGQAYAHYPHDQAYWVAVSPDATQRRLVTSLERIDLDVLGRSENGLDWAARIVQAKDDGAVGSGAFLTPDRLILATQRRGLLVSEDAGDTLASAPSVSDAAISRVVASPSVLEDGVGFATGTTAIWRTEDSGLGWTPVWRSTSDGFTDVDVSPDFGSDGRVCALEAETLSCSSDAGLSWTRTDLPAGVFRVSVGGDHRVWATVRGGGLYVSDDDGGSWSLTGFDGDDLTAIAELSGGLVLLAEADTAEWRSMDRGATWSRVDVLDIHTDQSRDGVNFFDFVEGPDGAVYLTNWFGLARSDDRGVTYTFYNTEPIQNTHSITLTEGADGALLAWVGTYGGGPLLTDIHSLATQTFPGLTKRFTRSSPVTPDWDRDGVAIFDEGYCTWRTTDHGDSWQRIAQDPNVEGSMEMGADVKGVALSPDPADDPFVLTTNGQNVMAFATSEDLGDTWTLGAQDPPCASDGFTVGLSPRWPDESRAWAACGGTIYESSDRGESWFVMGDTGTSFVFRFAEQMDGALLVATSDGLWRIDDAATTRIAFAGLLVDGVAASTQAGDDTVFALVPAAGWMRSDDGGATWATLLAPTADVPRMVAMSPSFAEDGTVAVAGYGGAWASTDRGDSWYSIYTEEVYETYHDAWVTTGTWTDVPWEGASSGEVLVADEVGATKTLVFNGIGVAVEAPAGGGGCGGGAEGVLAVTLDDDAPEEVELPAEDNTAWRSDVLADGWHTLRLGVISGTVAVDDVRVTRILVHEPDTRRCGCGSASGAALLGLPLWLARRRRSGGP